MRRSISLTAPGIHSGYLLRCIVLGRFIRAASNPVNHSHWRLAWKVRRAAVGFFIALFPQPNGGTILSSPETTCFSSGRKNGCKSGAPRMIIPCGRSSRWTSYGRSRRLGIRRAYKRTRGVRSPLRCVPSSRDSAWKATFGIRSRTGSVSGFAPFELIFSSSSSRESSSAFHFLAFQFLPLVNVKCFEI